MAMSSKLPAAPKTWQRAAVAIGAIGLAIAPLNNAATAASSAPAASTNTVTPYQYGGKGNAKRKQCNITVSGTSLTVNSGAGCVFTAADIGKLITVPQAGATSSTAPIASVGVAAAGSGYTSIPTASLGSVGSGYGALLGVNMKLASATVQGGGAGCTNGSQTFTVDLGVYGTQAQFTGTVTGGVLGGALTVSQAGSYSQLPVSPSTKYSTVTGPACTTAPIVTTTWAVDSVTVRAPGVNYPSGVTASLSGGGGTGASLSNPSLATAPIAVHATTIAAVTDATHITLGAAAPNAVTATLVTLTWGSDDQAAINACLSAAATGNVYCYIPPAASGYWGVDPATPLQLAPSSIPAKITGGGPERSIIVALAGGPYLAYRNTTFASGGTVRDIRFDGNRLVDDVGYMACSQMQVFDNAWFANARLGSPLVIGDGVTPGCNSSVLDHVMTVNGGGILDSANLYFGNDFPAYTLKINATDVRASAFMGVNANAAGIYLASGSTWSNLWHPHVWGGATTGMPIGFSINGAAKITDAQVDKPTGIGFHIATNNVQIKGGIVGGANNPVGVELDSARTNIAIEGLDLSTIATSLKRYVVTGTGVPDPSVRFRGNPGVEPAFFASSSCQNPSGTTSASYVHMGLAVTQAPLVPKTSGRFTITLSGNGKVATAGQLGQAQIRYDKGGPPRINWTGSGTAAGAEPVVATANEAPIGLTAVAADLAVGQPYWLDAVQKTSAGTVTFGNLCMTAVERE